MRNSKHFNISDIDINRIRVSNPKLFRKEKKSYKRYILYEHGDKYVPLNICFNNTLLGYYNEHINKDIGKNDSEYIFKKMNFIFDDNDLAYKIIDIFEYIEKELKIALKKYLYCNGIDNYFRATVYKRTCFNKKGCKDTSIVPDKNTKYECKPLLQIQSIYYVLEDKKDHVQYPQIFMEQCGYEILTEYNIAHKDFVFTNSETQSEEEFNNDNDKDEQKKQQTYFNVLIITIKA